MLSPYFPRILMHHLQSGLFGDIQSAALDTDQAKYLILPGSRLAEAVGIEDIVDILGGRGRTGSTWTPHGVLGGRETECGDHFTCDSLVAMARGEKGKARG